MRKKLLRQALIIAKNQIKSHPMYNQFMHWSFIVINDKIIGYDINNFGSPESKLGYVNRITEVQTIEDKLKLAQRHSEYNAFNKYRRFISPKTKWELINIRLTKLGMIKLSQPCNCCFNYMKTLGCYSCYFTTESGFAKLLF
jgi:hypothetical protein